jgi:hypothetical protein
MMPDKYYQLAYADVKGACAVEYLSDRELGWELTIGQSVAARWPPGMSFRMSDDHRKDVALIDNVSNLEDVLLVSPRIRDFLLLQKLPELEFLSVSILDHKGRVASRDYTIAHCCRVVDCVDQDKSDFDWDGLANPSMITREIVLKDELLGEADRMFRPKFVPGVVLFKENLMQAVQAQQFAGVAFVRELFGDYTVYR